MGFFFNFSKDKNPAYDRRMTQDRDKINQIMKDIPVDTPSFDMGGILGTPFYGHYNSTGKLVPYQQGGTLVGAPYQEGGILPYQRGGRVPFYESGGIISGETIIPSTALQKFNQNGSIVRPNGIIINRSQQAIRNQKLI